MQPYDVYLAVYPWHGCGDPRPWLLVRPSPSGGYECFAISTKDYGDPCFAVSADDPDFPATGLRSTSYVYDDHLQPIPALAFLKRWGAFSGDLLTRFKDYAGV